MYVRVAHWCAQNLSALCTSPGTPGAPARLHVGVVPGQGNASAKPQRVVLPVLTQSRQKPARCHHVQVTYEHVYCMAFLEYDCAIRADKNTLME